MNDKQIRVQLEKWRGYSAYELAVQNGFIGTEKEWLESLKSHADEVTVNHVEQDEEHNIQLYLKDMPVRDSSPRNAQEELDLKYDKGDLIQDPAAGGEGWPLSAEAGRKILEVAQAKARVLTQQVVLTTAGWAQDGELYKQTAEVTGVLADQEKASVLASPIEDRVQEKLYTKAEVRVAEQNDGAVAFTAKKQPEADITVNVMIVIKGEGTGDIEGGTGADGYSPTIEVSKAGTTTMIVINDINGPQTVHIEDGKTGKKGDAGEPGADGVSPTIEVNKEGNVATLTITDAKGEKTLQLHDGERGETGPKGEPGRDGVSTTVEVEKENGVTKLTFSDAKGVKSAEILDGQRGEPGLNGAPGKDGFSPTVSVDKADNAATITFTDAQGTKTVNIMDGEKGDPGEQGEPGRDGFSPFVEVEKVGEKTIITITDAEKEHIVVLEDGERGPQGEPGKDAVPPVVQITNIDGGHRVTITDEKGKKAFDVMDGVNTSSNLVNGRAAASLRGIRTKEDGSSDYYVGYAATALGESTKASGSSAFAVGAGANASGDLSAAFGSSTTASGEASHAEGELTIASGRLSHAEGLMAVASGENSHAEGYSTEAASDNQHVQGKNNVVDHEGRYAHIVGNGTANDNAGRSNAHTLDWEGNAWFAGDVYVGGKSMDEAKKLGAGGGASVDSVSDEEVIAYLAELDLLVTVTDGDGTVLADENDNILIW